MYNTIAASIFNLKAYKPKTRKMKKLSFLFAIVLMASMPFLTSCGTDDGTTEVKPTINFTGGAGFTSSDVTLQAGDPIKVGISAFSNTSSKTKLKTLKVVRTFNNTPFTALDSTLNSTDAFNITLESFAYPAAGVEKWTFTITDKDGEFSEISFNITTTAGGPINEYSQKILGSYDNSAYGSSFASADGTVYSLADAKANAAKIDWMYYYGATAFATFSAPSDASASSVFSGTNGPANWSVRNDTKLGKVTLPTGLTWASITTDAEIVILASEASDSKVTALTVGQIVAFKTVTGKLGLIKVEAITGTGAGTITYSVKVQK
jgi:hypothetical protein